LAQTHEPKIQVIRLVLLGPLSAALRATARLAPAADPSGAALLEAEVSPEVATQLAATMVAVTAITEMAQATTMVWAMAPSQLTTPALM
jgi:hypothetical protein